ncbi:MAG: FxLYD domain-containing protein [Xanthomonadales bacterium]|nr:FxLYD domain-containing protein [Xanthomonadales bacterium]
MKTCIHCKEQMQPDARVCPNCQRTQSRLDARDPRTGLVLMVLLLAAVFGAQHFFKPSFDSLDGFSTAVANGAVVVSESSFAFVPDTPNSCDSQKVVIVGKLHNTSSHGVKGLEVIVSFYNSSHHLVDVVTESIWQTVIPANGEVSFRAASTPTAKAAEYITFDIKVTGGRDLD